MRMDTRCDACDAAVPPPGRCHARALGPADAVHRPALRRAAGALRRAASPLSLAAAPAECLALLDAHRAAAERPAEVALALWFHDAIYDVHRHDNEAQSADWARDALTAAGVPDEAAATGACAGHGDAARRHSRGSRCAACSSTSTSRSSARRAAALCGIRAADPRRIRACAAAAVRAAATRHPFALSRTAADLSDAQTARGARSTGSRQPSICDRRDGGSRCNGRGIAGPRHPARQCRRSRPGTRTLQSGTGGTSHHTRRFCNCSRS